MKGRKQGIRINCSYLKNGCADHDAKKKLNTKLAKNILLQAKQKTTNEFSHHDKLHTDDLDITEEST